MLQADYGRGTKDSDVLETLELTSDVQAHLLEVAGADTELHKRHRLYIDIVRNGLPFLPHAPEWHAAAELNDRLHRLRLDVLDVTDVSDVGAMVERGLVLHERLVTRFRAAVECFQDDARAEDLPKFVENLHRVERDLFGVAESAIDLPEWI